MSSSDDEMPEVRKRKKGIINADKYKRNIIKKAKILGTEHINWKGKMVPAQQPGSNNCR